MEMPSIGSENGLAADQAPRYGKSDVEDGDKHREKRRSHTEEGCRLCPPDDSKTAKEKSEEQAAGVAEEHRGGIEVVPEEAQQGPGKGYGNQYQGAVLVQDARE